MRSAHAHRSGYWPMWCLGLLFLAAGCQSVVPGQVLSPMPTMEPIVRAQADQPAAGLAQAKKPVGISLDTVLRLAQDQNSQVRLARLRLDDATNEQMWANKAWLPDLSIGLSAIRHDGGIQDFQGNLVKSRFNAVQPGLELAGKYDWKEVLYRRVEAERKVWQSKGELSKMSSENLLEASTTYVTMLAARSGVAVSIETELRLRDLLDQTNKLAKVEPGLQVEVSRIETELMAQTVLTVKLREAGKAAAAKLAYLIGLDPCCEFLIADKHFVPINLVDAKTPTPQLVEKALTTGPGIRELEGLLHTVEAARNPNYGLAHWLPTVQIWLGEGGIGAAPSGTSLSWANRFDAKVGFSWSINEWVFSKERKRQADANIQQVHLSYHDLRQKLTLGVQEARGAIHSGHEQIQLAEKHIQFAEQLFKLSDQRLQQNIKGRSPSEVLLALRSLGGAKLEYIQAVRDLNRAQLRLFVLVGASETAPIAETPEARGHHPRQILPRDR